MGIRPGLAENGRKKFYGGSAVENCARHWDWETKQVWPSTKEEKSLQEMGYMFEQINNPAVADRKTWKERLGRGAVTLAVITIVLGVLLYALR
jgi:hypothetical protein